jgi:hypothetical protein
MASIRDNILGALVTRLATISGWDVQLRGAVNTADAAVKAVVLFVAEDKRLANNEHYVCTMQVAVFLTARAEDAHPTTDAGNPYRYLDRLVVLAEKKIHDPDSWGLNPDFTDVVVNGHDVSDPTEENEVTALMRLTFTYRHDYQDPEA